MTLHPHCGHSKIMEVLARARAADNLPAAMLIHGPAGVGKQHLALWVGRLLLCRDPGAVGPCGECRSCHLASRLEHPDLHWYFPLPRPKNASTPEKLAKALEEARYETLAELRERPLRAIGGTEARSLYLAAARTLRSQAHRRPSMGEHQVFIIAEAEALAPRASNSEAANALLKLLEEPPAGTSLILTSAEPGRLLPTIRSRTTHFHLPPLPTEEVRNFLVSQVGVERREADRVAVLARGSIGRALGFLGEGGEPGPLEQTRQQALALLLAALANDPGERSRAALEFRPVGARGLGDLFNFLEEALEELARVTMGAPAAGYDSRAQNALAEAAERLGIHPSTLPRAMGRVDEARNEASGNVNPQLLVYGLLHALRRDLVSQDTAPGS